MSLSVRNWTQRRLLYPLAIFAIIAPTVVLALFGTYALRETVLRPPKYREQLADARKEVRNVIEKNLAELEAATAPPTTADDVARAQPDIEQYFRNRYTTTIASRGFVGIAGHVEPGSGVDGSRGLAPPPELKETLTAIHGGGGGNILRDKVVIDALVDGKPVRRVYAVFTDDKSGGFVAWELVENQITRLVDTKLQEMDLGNDAISISLVDRGSFHWDPGATAPSETLGFVPAHDDFLGDRYLVMSLDKNRQLTQDDTLLSNIYILIAVLCVPIVASATLMAVHMILREASEARKKVDFVSNVTHELKTPLTSIRMFVETLKLGRVKDPEKVQACLDTIMNETQRLGTLIDHVLSFSKVENQVKKYNIGPNDLAQVVIDTINFFKGQAPRPRDRVQRRILAGLPTSALFDKDAVREVVLNLLTNAMKYSPGEKPIVVTVGAGEKELFIAVQDQGIGIDPQYHERIFEKFFRVDEDMTRNVDGTGLGLAIVAEIVKAHGGRITVDSALGRGSTFTVYLPWRHSRQTVPRRKATRNVTPSEPVLEPGEEPEEVLPGEVEAEVQAEKKPAPERQPANVRLLSLLVPALLLAGATALAQPAPGPDGEPETAPKKEGGTLQPRPEEDAAALAWVKKLGGMRPKAVSVEARPVVSPVLSPEGDRLYYYRPIKDPNAPKLPPKKPVPVPGMVTPPVPAGPPVKYALYVVGPDKPETRLMETGPACDAPLFLPEGRMVLTQRRHDTNEDGEVSQLDDAMLVVCNRDGEAARTAATLNDGGLPVGVWRGGNEVLVSEPGQDEPNGWIVSINLVKGTRERVVQGFSVSLVLADDKLLVQRLVAPPPPPDMTRMWNPWRAMGGEPEAAPDKLLATLADPPEHMVYDPADGSETALYGSLVQSRIACVGEGAYWGEQRRKSEKDRMNYYPYGMTQDDAPSEILIIDDIQHRDTRNNGARYDHVALGWIKERGLLVLQKGNLRSRIMLLDRALKWHELGELDMSVRGVCAAGGGLKLCWLEVEDTDENGILEPWKDNCRPFFATLE